MGKKTDKTVKILGDVAKVASVIAAVGGAILTTATKKD